MEASGSSSYFVAIEETTASDKDPDPHPRRGQWVIALMKLPVLALV